MKTFSLAITGSGGSGVVTAGKILLHAVAYAGYWGWMAKSFGPQIRGGESAVMLHLADTPVEHNSDTFDLLLGLDWHGFERFADEAPLSEAAQIWHDEHTPPPTSLSGYHTRALPLKSLASQVPKGHINMVAAGALGAWLGLPFEALEKSLRKLLSRKGEEVVQQNLQLIRLGFDQCEPQPDLLSSWERHSDTPWLVQGNPLTGLGLLRGGIRFFSAYPITPATDLSEWLASRLPTQNGVLIQSEDELAAINMAIGASFAGAPAATATSGPGLSLMMEGIGLAIAAEVPVTVVNVNRGGPSTGIPTKSEQSDLESLLLGPHGDSPHVVTAPLGIADLAATAQWSVWLAETLQTAVLMASEQRLAMAEAILPPVEALDLPTPERGVKDCSDWVRFATDAMSPLPVPGQDSCRYVADGLEHTPTGVPSSFASDHRAQLNRRARKLTDFHYGERAFEWDGPHDAETLLIGTGSLWPLLKHCARARTEAGHPTAALGLRLLMPLPIEQLRPLLEKAQRRRVVEQTHGAQLLHYLQGQLPDIPLDGLARPGPLPIRPGEVHQFLEEDG